MTRALPHYPSAIEKMMQAELRKLSRQGRLVDTAFKVFAKQVFPTASQEQTHVMRVCFFAGAAEMFTLMTAALDEGSEETPGDLEFMQGWIEELARYHERTFKASKADKGQHEN